jgi:hypothetical protein
MNSDLSAALDFILPIPLSSYPPASPNGLMTTLADRVAMDPFNAVATAIFVLAVIHTFAAARFTKAAHDLQRPAGHQRRAPRPRSCTSSAKWKWCSACGRSSSWPRPPFFTGGPPRPTT